MESGAGGDARRWRVCDVCVACGRGRHGRRTAAAVAVEVAAVIVEVLVLEVRIGALTVQTSSAASRFVLVVPVNPVAIYVRLLPLAES